MPSPSPNLPILSMPMPAMAGDLPAAASAVAADVALSGATDGGASFGRLFEAKLAQIRADGSSATPRTAADLLRAVLEGADASAGDALTALMAVLLGQTAGKVSPVGTAQEEGTATDLRTPIAATTDARSTATTDPRTLIAATTDARSTATTDPLALAALVHAALAGAGRGQTAPLVGVQPAVAAVDATTLARGLTGAGMSGADLVASSGRSAGTAVAGAEAELAASVPALATLVTLAGAVAAGDAGGQEAMAGDGLGPQAGKAALPTVAASAAANEFSAAVQNAVQRGGGEAPRTAGDAGMTHPEAAVLQLAGAGHAASNQTANTVDDRLHAQVGTSAWNEEFGQKIVWLVQRQEGRAELVLTPPQMGRIEISLQVSNDQASALFTSANPAVREAIEAALPRLREVLAEAGIQLGQAQVGAEGQSSQQAHENSDNRPDSATASRDDAQPAHAAAVEVLARGWVQRGLVDTFA